MRKKLLAVAFVASMALGTAVPFASSAFADPPAGVPGEPNCHGLVAAELAREYGGLAKAAAALDFGSVKDLQNAIRDVCTVDNGG